MNFEFEIKKKVEKACNDSLNALTPAFWSEHILVVHDYSKQLCEVLDHSNDEVSLASLLHDISAVYDFKTLPTHAIDSATIAAELLLELHYPVEKIEVIKNSIIKHSFPLQLGEGTLDEVILSNADAMAQISNLPYWLFFAFKILGMNYSNGLSWYQKKIESNWNALIEPAKIIISDKYKEAQRIIQQVTYE